MSVDEFCPFSHWIVVVLEFESLKKMFSLSIYISPHFVGDVFCKCILPKCSRHFIVLAGSFTKYNFLVLMRSNLSSFPFMDCAFGVTSKNTSPSPRF